MSAPAYPLADTAYAPPVYTYTYLLTPAATWADFHNLTVTVNTPYRMVKDGTFHKTSGGYEAFFPALPTEDLQFSLADLKEGQVPEVVKPDIHPGQLLLFLLPFLSAIVGVAAVLILVIVLCNKRKKKERKE